MIGVSLDKFRQNLGKIVRPNRFSIEIKPPEGLVYEADLQSIYYRVKSAQIPARTIGEAEFKYYGMTMKLPGDTNYEDLTITLLNDETWQTRDFFENWQDYVMTVTDNSKQSAFALIGDSHILIHQYDMNDKIIASYRFNAIFPKSVGEIELSMENENTIEEFQVIFAYAYWEQIEI